MDKKVSAIETEAQKIREKSFMRMYTTSCNCCVYYEVSTDMLCTQLLIGRFSVMKPLKVADAYPDEDDVLQFKMMRFTVDVRDMITVGHILLQPTPTMIYLHCNDDVYTQLVEYGLFDSDVRAFKVG